MHGPVSQAWLLPPSPSLSALHDQLCPPSPPCLVRGANTNVCHARLWLWRGFPGYIHTSILVLLSADGVGWEGDVSLGRCKCGLPGAGRALPELLVATGRVRHRRVMYCIGHARISSPLS